MENEGQPRKSWWRRWMCCLGDNPDAISFNFTLVGLGFLAISAGFMIICMGIAVLIGR